MIVTFSFSKKLEYQKKKEGFQKIALKNVFENKKIEIIDWLYFVLT